jgi:hypothetical protein
MVGLNDQVSGKWFTANESVVSVDMPSGIAEIIGEGSTQGIGIKTFHFVEATGTNLMLRYLLSLLL